jgi:hypothetical protein
MIADNLRTGTHLVHLVLRTAAGALLAPILLVVLLILFLVILADFTRFRLRETRNGPPRPKALWEF